MTGMLPLESLLLVSYKLSIVTKALSSTVLARISIITDGRTDSIQSRAMQKALL